MSETIKFPRTTYGQSLHLPKSLISYLKMTSKDMNCNVTSYLTQPIEDETAWQETVNIITFNKYDADKTPLQRIDEGMHQATQYPSMVQLDDNKYHQAAMLNTNIEINEVLLPTSTLVYQDIKKYQKSFVDQNNRNQAQIKNLVMVYDSKMNLLRYDEIDFDTFNQALSMIIKRLQNNIHNKLQKDNIHEIISRIEDLNHDDRAKVLAHFIK